MNSDSKFTTLDLACRSIKQQDPRLLAEISRQLSSVLAPDSVFNPATIRYADHDPAGTSPITYRQVAEYFLAATGKYVPVLFETPERTDQSCRVLVERNWLERQAAAAKERVGFTYAIQAHAGNEVVKAACRVNDRVQGVDQPGPMTGNGLENLLTLLTHQNSQRKAQEAAGKEAIARKAAEARALKAETLLEAREAELKAERENYLLLIEELNAAQRQIDELQSNVAYMEQELELSTGSIEFLNPQNPASPPMVRELYECWAALTNTGQHEITHNSSKGTGPLIADWLRKRNGKQPSDSKVKYFRTFLTSEGRKQGGAIASTRRNG